MVTDNLKFPQQTTPDSLVSSLIEEGDSEGSQGSVSLDSSWDGDLELNQFEIDAEKWFAPDDRKT
ncbi:MAG: hypothetical protein M0R48_09680 [Candidatus Omnitrophica bacterium]|nr:hypothetical protein [Candidatus Omnitrophota bacterium]